MHSTPDLSILVVSFNTRDMTIASLRSVLEHTANRTFEIIVVDNASHDGSAEAISQSLPSVHVVQNANNRGFAAAVNQAAQFAVAPRLLLLNPDTLLRDGSIETLLDFADGNPTHGIYGVRTLYPDGSLRPGSCWMKPTLWSMICRATGASSLFRGHRWFDSESVGDLSHDSSRVVDIVTGCFLLIDRPLWDRLGGFDEQFFLYGEDADLCLRARRLGARPVVCPDATIIHFGSASDPDRAQMRTKLMRSKCLLLRKHWSRPAAGAGLICLQCSALSRALALRLISVFTGDSGRRAESDSWLVVWRARREWSAPLQRRASLNAPERSDRRA